MRVTFLLAGFYLQCPVDMKRLAFQARNSEHNPRKARSTVLRLLEPKATATVFPRGWVSISGASDEDTARRAARRVTCIVQACGHPEAKCAGFHVLTLGAVADLRFPVRLEQFAQKWPRALYEPEVNPCCMIQVRSPQVSMNCSVGGKLRLQARTVEDAQEALRLAYPIFHEYRR